MTVPVSDPFLTAQWREIVGRSSDRELADELIGLQVTGLRCDSVRVRAITTEAARRLRERT